MTIVSEEPAIGDIDQCRGIQKSRWGGCAIAREIPAGIMARLAGSLTVTGKPWIMKHFLAKSIAAWGLLFGEPIPFANRHDEILAVVPMSGMHRAFCDQPDNHENSR